MPVIATNTSANTALIYLNKNSSEQSKSLAKLSSGSRIVRASDDAAGLAVGTKLKADVTTLKQAATNAVQARSVLQTADGAMARVGDILQRMKSLAAQAISGSVDTTGRGFINTEYQQLLTEIGNISTTTQFNGTNLINGSYSQTFQVGVAATDIITVNFGATGSIVNMSTGTAGLAIAGTTVAGANGTAATNASTNLDVAITTVSTARATVGALLSRFEYRGDVIDSSIENLTSAQSAIMDVDIAAEQSNLVSRQVLTEASIAALSQANQMKSSLLALVR
ncbi:MAG: flagellin [Micavibrio aeruginosavorus]|uniref:Flagellin n=1 Tax=Micavibrio aeruginosavorus TaxID=349221 RepID=A0A2W5FSE9_9BACT|nr:MAG: flagellin [Micavibrio aeruginosavorus]